MVLPHRNIHKYTWTSPDGNTHIHNDHVLIYGRWHSITLDVQTFRGAVCNADHYLMATEVRERLAGSKQETQKFDVERFNLRQLSELEVRKQYQIKISNRSAALENSNDSEDINMALENVKENFITSAKDSLGLFELKQHKPWYNEKCLRFLDQRTQAKMHGYKTQTKAM